MNRPSYLLFKQCSECGEILHVSKFRKIKNGKYGVMKICKECRKIYEKKYRDEHREEISEYNKKYREEHKEERKEYDKKYYEEHKEEKSIRFKKWYKENKEERDRYCKNWQRNNPHVGFNSNGRRRSRLENQGNGITKEQWFECFEFFNWECAYSGIQLTKDNRSIDHIVALDNDGEHEIWNCVPCYASYNYSKHTKNMLDWYLQQEYFNINRLTKIYEWRIYAYWKWNEKESV